MQQEHIDLSKDNTLRGLAIRAFQSLVNTNANLMPIGGVASEPTLLEIASYTAFMAMPVDGQYLRTKLFFQRNGIEQLVIEDTVTPSNNTPLPVKVTSATGPINITAGDINVQLTDVGVNYDSVRIGNGTNLLLVNADGSINVKTTNADLNAYKVHDEAEKTGLITTVYYGFANQTGAWYILQTDSVAKTYRYINGTSNYATAWSDREALTYTYLYSLTW